MSFVKVEFERDDQRDPLNWSVSRKWVTTIVACTYTAFVGELQSKLCCPLPCTLTLFPEASASSSYPVGYPSMRRDLNCTGLQATAGLTTYISGFSIAPLLLSPLSEEFGRRTIYVVSVHIRYPTHV